MIVKLLTEDHLEFLSSKGGCTGSSESTLVKIPHCWKSHVVAQMHFHYFSLFRTSCSLKISINTRGMTNFQWTGHSNETVLKDNNVLRSLVCVRSHVQRFQCQRLFHFTVKERR